MQLLVLQKVRQNAIKTMQTFARNHCKYFFVKKGTIVDGSDFRHRPTPEIFLMKSCGVIFFEIFHKKVLTFSRKGSIINLSKER